MNLRIPVCVALFVLPCLGQEEEPVAGGLVLEFRGNDARTSDFRFVRRAALLVEAGVAPTPFLKPGPFEAIWHGALRLEKRERLYFSFEGLGRVAFLIDGEVVLQAHGEDLSTVESERLRLNGGDHPLEIRYSSPKSGAGRFRLYWKGRDFARETIPPKAYRHYPGSASARSAAQAATLRKGRHLVAVNGCAKCHHPSKVFDASTAMPEVLAKAPSLFGVGSRFRAGWLADWILSPRKIRPSARMPALVHSVVDAKSLAAFLASSKTEGLKTPPPLGNSVKGGALFTQLGCITC
ncbi:MAG: PA14 domain-containing protein, partial [Opitutales bacterium]